MPCTARNGRITLKARRGRTLRRGVAVDGQQQLRALGIDGFRPLAGLCGDIIAFTGTQRDVIRVGLQQRKQSLGGLGRHLFFFDDSPCARVASAVAGINADPVGRVAHHRPERFFPTLISPGAEQRCFPKEKCCTEADDAHQKADDRRSGRAALFSPACVSWI